MTTMDESRLEQFMGQMVGYMTGGAMCFGVWLGDELGLYRSIAGKAGPDRGGDRRGGRLQRPAGPRVVGWSGGRRPRRLRRRGGSL